MEQSDFDDEERRIKERRARQEADDLFALKERRAAAEREAHQEQIANEDRRAEKAFENLNLTDVPDEATRGTQQQQRH